MYLEKLFFKLQPTTTMNKESKIKELKELSKSKREIYLKYKEESIKAQEKGSKGFRTEPQIEMDKHNQKVALNKSYSWACKKAFKDPLDKILDQIERNSKN